MKIVSIFSIPIKITLDGVKMNTGHKFLRITRIFKNLNHW